MRSKTVLPVSYDDLAPHVSTSIRLVSHFPIGQDFQIAHHNVLATYRLFQGFKVWNTS